MSRGWLVAAVAALAAAVALPSQGATARSAAPRDCLRRTHGIDLQRVTLAGLRRALARHRVTSVQLVRAYRRRIAAYDRSGAKLNSIRHLNPHAIARARTLDRERRKGHVRGRLHGIPVLLKDNFGTTDEPTTAGSIALAGVRPKHDSTVARRLRAAGAVILGKANLSEFAGWVDLDMPPGYSSLGGQVINAYDRDFSPSGSSAGSGVAASMAFSGFTFGTETSGSILSPSDANSIVGVKTTLGLVSRYGILPLAPDFDVPGPMVRTVRDAAIVLGAVAGPDPRDPMTAASRSHLPPRRDYTAFLRRGALRGKRFAYSQEAHEELDDQHRALFDAAIARIRRMGGTVVASRSMSAEYGGLTEIGAIPNEFKASLNAYLHDEMPGARVHNLHEIIAFNDEHPDKVKYGQDLLRASDATPGREELFAPQAEPTRAQARSTIDTALEETDADAILTPGNFHANVGAAAGYPTVIEPLGYTDGGRHPFGLGFLGRAYSEPRLLGYAYAYEQAAHVRALPTDVNPSIVPKSCRRAGRKPRLPRLRVTVALRGKRLRIVVRHVRAKRVRVVVRRGKNVVARRRVRARHHTARTRVRARQPGVYRVTAFDPGPPPRTAHATRRVPPR